MLLLSLVKSRWSALPGKAYRGIVGVPRIPLERLDPVATIGAPMHLPTMRCLTLLAVLGLSACGGGGGGDSTPNPTPPPTPSASVQVFQNVGFEDSAPLFWQGDTGVIQTASAGSTTAVPHGGTKFAWLAGYDTAYTDQIYQDVNIPATAQSAKVDLYLKVVTSQTGSTPIDLFTINALDTSGNVLSNGVLLTKSNADAKSPTAYTAYSVDLLPFKGQVVRLQFKGVQAGVTSTSFLLDDVTVTIGLASAADLKPVITGFTPTSGIAGEVTVQITGKNFFGLTSLELGGVATSFTQKDATSLSAPLGATAKLGSAAISLANAQGTGTSATNFTVGFGTATVSSMNPSQGPVGTTVVLTGTYLGYPGTTVTLNGSAVTPITATATRISFTVPSGATTGNVVVTTPNGSVAPRTFTVNPSGSTLDLHVSKLQLTQSTQTLDNGVPIIAGKAGLVRVFVLANQTNTATPSVQVTLLNNGLAVAGYPKTVSAPGASVPLALDESALGSSWNLTVPSTDLTTPTGSGYSLQATVDPTAAIAEADKLNNAMTVTLTGATVPSFKTTIFPVILSSGTGNITEANKDAWVARLAKMFPVASVDVAVGAPFTGSISALDPKDEGSTSTWSPLLNDLATKHAADGAAAADRYYYGALSVSYGSGIAGLGYVPGTASSAPKFRTAIGWDKTTGYSDGGLFPEVFAHETGHNMGRHHSPCGGAGTPDENYPYANASIGVWGYDSVLNALHSPDTNKDIMAYCSPNWVSDYVYKSILTFRNGTGGFLTLGPEDAPLPKSLAVAKECLIVRGIVHANGKVDLLPAFRTQALPSQTPLEGEFTLQCLDAKGATLFSSALDLVDLGCGPLEQERHFVMALPLGTKVLDAVAGLNIMKSGQIQNSVRSLPANARIVSAAPEARRAASGHTQLTWDASIHPAALVRDVDTGEVIAILSGGRQIIATQGRRFDLVLSDGVTGPTHRLEIAE